MKKKKKTNKTSKSISMKLIMEYMQKRINEIDQTRIELKNKYPDLLPK